MREIVYSQTISGAFEPEPTRAQRRRASRERREAENRAFQKSQSIQEGLIVLVVIALTAVCIWLVSLG